MSSAREIIARWPTQQSIKEDLNLKNRETVAMWYMRNRIPDRYWIALVAAAKKRGAKLTLAELASQHDALGENAA
jgi:hypothetical protein